MKSIMRNPASQLKRGLAVLALVAAPISIGAAVAFPNAAGASATGCTRYGLGGVAVFCGQVNGSGLHVNNVQGYYGAGGLIGWECNARIEVQFMNNSGAVYASYLSGVQGGCNSSGGWTLTFNRGFQSGTVRVTLLSNGAYVAAIQESIHS